MAGEGQSYNDTVIQAALALINGQVAFTPSGTQPVSLAGNQPVNVQQINGNTASTGAGIPASGALRVVLAVGATPTLAEFAATTLGVSQTLIAGGTSRQAVVIANDSDQVLYLRYGAVAATTTSYSVKIPVGGIYEVPRGFVGIEIRAIGAAVGAAGAVHVTSVI